MKKTLGGDRLGSGKKMEVDLHNYGRSTHDLGYLWRSTMSAGTLVPFLSEVALPGDTFDIDLDCDIKTHPTVGPLFGSYKVQLDVFMAPIRLYQGQLHNNKLGIGMNMASIKLPVLSWIPDLISSDPADTNYYGGDLNTVQINPSCILAYLGLRGWGQRSAAVVTPVPRLKNGIGLLMYWEVYKNYYANKQEEIGAVIHTPGITIDTTQVVDIQIGSEILEQDVYSAPAEPLNNGSYMVISYNTVPIDLRTIFIKLADGREIRADQFGNIISDVTGAPNIMTINYDWARWGINQYAYYWRYATPGDTITSEITVQTFDLNEIDNMRERILSETLVNAPFDVLNVGHDPYQLLTEGGGLSSYSMTQNQEGLGIKTYQSDLFNNWLSTEWIDGAGGISEITAIDTSGGSFTIDTLNLSKKVYDMLNRIAVSGGSYDDWMDAVYTHDRYTRCESPMYMGGLIKELVFQEVVSNSEAQTSTEGTSDTIQPLGTLAGKGVMGRKHKGGKVTIKVDEPSWILGIVSLTPRIDYSQGNNWNLDILTMDDLHKPALDEIGFQELNTEQMAWWDTQQDSTGAWITQSAGKQPAWINYMTNINKVYGNFATEEEGFMILNRNYEYERTPATDAWRIADLTTYIDPAKFNNIFAQTSLDSQNFWTQISVDMTVRRKISARLMPNL